MKTLKYILLAALPFLFLNSKCNDKKEPILWVVKGRIMQSCSEPYSNVDIVLKGDGSIFGSTYAEGKADENGYFSIAYEPNSSNIRLYAPNKTLEFLQTTPELDLGEVQVYGTVNFIIKLEVQNPYSENDTLYYYDWNYPQNGASHWVKKVAGPFVSGVIDTVKNMGYMKYPIRFGEVPKMDINHYINDFSENTNLYFNTPFCSTNYAEAVIKIE